RPEQQQRTPGTGSTQQEKALRERVPTGQLINAEWVEASSGKTLPVHDPATGKELLRIQDGNSDDALKALTAADEVQAEWAQTAPRERAEILRRAFDLVHE